MTDATPLDNAAARARLREIVAQKSLSVGPQVTLASGAASRFYFNMKPTVFDAEGAALIGDLILDAVAGDDPYYDHVGGMEVGAIPIVAALTLRSWQRRRPLAGFFVRKRPKDHGTRRLVEGELAAGTNVLIVEDVTTTGGSTLNAVRAVREIGGRVSKAVTLVDRLAGASEALGREGIELVAIATAAEFDIEGAA